MPDQPAPNLEEARRIAEAYVRDTESDADPFIHPDTVALSRAYLALLEKHEVAHGIVDAQARSLEQYRSERAGS